MSEFWTLCPNCIAFTTAEAEVQKQALLFVPARYIRSPKTGVFHEKVLRIFKNCALDPAQTKLDTALTLDVPVNAVLKTRK